MAPRAVRRRWTRPRATSGDSGPRGAPATLERVCTVYEGYHEALAKMHRADRELRVTRALDALRREPMRWEATPVLLYGFDDLTELQLDTIETLGGIVGAPVTVSLAYEPGRVVFAGRAAAFERLRPLADSHTKLEPHADYYAQTSREALHHIERSLLTNDPTRVTAGDAVRLLEGGSPRAELELVAGEVRALLDGGVPPADIAIVHRFPEKIAGLLGEVLGAFDIPYSMRDRVRFADTAIGRALLGLSRCAAKEGEPGGSARVVARPWSARPPRARGQVGGERTAIGSALGRACARDVGGRALAPRPDRPRRRGGRRRHPRPHRSADGGAWSDSFRRPAAPPPRCSPKMTSCTRPVR